MTTNLRVVIIALSVVLCVVVVGMVTITLVEIVKNKPLDIPNALVTISTAALAGLVGMLVPAEIKRGKQPPDPGGGR